MKKTIGKCIISAIIIGEIYFFITMGWFVIFGFIIMLVVIGLLGWLLSWLFKEDTVDEYKNK